jgi:RNA polymerase sigma-70 factor (ECF subfamily)
VPQPHEFKQVYDRHVRMVYNLCLNYLQNTEDAQEATQDVFLKVNDGMGTFRGEAAMRTWIYRITINCCLDVVKARKRKKRSLFSLFGPADGEAEKLSSPVFDHPGVQLEMREATERVFALINGLPEKQKTALLLKTMEGLPQTEIAGIMGLSEKAVESLLSRGRDTLRRKLGNSEG